MNCETVSGLLPELLAGALRGDGEQAVLHHLARCEGCRKELAFWARVSEAVRAEAPEMPEELFAGVREELLGPGTTGALECVKAAWNALGLAGSVCRLALSTAGINH